jgi:hydroxymethylbilane synthase
MTAAALCAAHGWAEDRIEIVAMKASGDLIQDRALAEAGGKALWTKELDRALIDREIDFAVHSMKDVETIRPAEISIAALLPRADVRDRLIGAESLDAIPIGGRVGTSSPRRSAQVKRARPDVQIVLFRGNVDTRLRKLSEGEADATLLAAAGLDRLQRLGIGVAVPIDVMLPAPAQGAVGIEALSERQEILDLLSPINDAPTRSAVLAERALLTALGAGCHSPVAAHASVNDTLLSLRAEILSSDGSESVAGETVLLAIDDGAPAALARDLLSRATPELRSLFQP